MQLKSAVQSELYPYDVNAISFVAHHISWVRFTVRSHWARLSGARLHLPNKKLITCNYGIRQRHIIISCLPLLFRDRSGNGVYSAGVVWLAGDVPTQDDAHKIQGKDHKQTDAGYSNLKTHKIQNNTCHVCIL